MKPIQVAFAAGFAVALSFLISCGESCGEPEQSPESGAPAVRRPNVVLIVIDSLRADHLSHYGYARPTAPALDSFRSHATLFTRAYSPAAWTNPSTASLLTGLLPARHGVRSIRDRLSEDALTLAELLSLNGWATAGISLNANVSQKAGLAQGFEVFSKTGGTTMAYPDVRRMVDLLPALLDDFEARPFFLYLHPMNVHGPYLVPEEHRSALLGVPPSELFEYRGSPMIDILRDGDLGLRASVDAAMLASLVDQYDTAIRYTTDRIGEIFDQLIERDLYDSSLIILTSDHGEELFEHGGFGHGYSLHREVVHVPLYLKLPQQRSPATYRSAVSLVDLMPTLVELLQLEGAGELDGRSLARDLETGSDTLGERTMFWDGRWQERFVGAAVESAGMRLIAVQQEYGGMRDESLLFDLDVDPAETRNLAASAPETARRLRAELDRHLADAANRALPPAPRTLDAAERRALELLGYLEPGDAH